MNELENLPSLHGAAASGRIEFIFTPRAGPLVAIGAQDRLLSVRPMTTIDRRTFLTRSAVAAGSATVASGSLAGLLARAAGAAPGGRATGSRA
ncbi:MAG: hypothetical protein KY441_11050, partial [Actinobacteria bacterium]|nr:hypothetical protein [Actinomycetota bacterium]